MVDIADGCAGISGEEEKVRRVSVNIVNWNGLQYLRDCIESVQEQTYGNIEIVVVDNGSSDGSIDYLQESCPHIRLVKNNRNEGFSRAHNQAIRMASGAYILPLNFDIVLDSHFVEEMVNAIEWAPEIGIVSGCLYLLNESEGKRVFDSTGITMNGMFPADRGQQIIDSGQYSQVEFIFGASGAAPLLKRKMLEDIKMDEEYFDEDYRIYVEDVDLCWRAQMHGWKALYTPQAIAYHKRGATRENNLTMMKEYVLLGHRNRYWTILKNAMLSNLLRNFAWILLVEWRFYLGHLLEGNYFVIKTIPMVIGGLRRMLSKRNEIQRRRKVSADYMERFLFDELKRSLKATVTKRLHGKA